MNFANVACILFSGSIAAWTGWGLVSLDGGPSIKPYFEKRIGGIDTYSHGRAIAKNCKALDQAALDLGIEPLSSFGFEDSFKNANLTWYDSRSGLKSVQALLHFVRLKSGAVCDTQAVITELERIETALKKAGEQNVSFCLTIDTTHTTNAMEHEQREGSFF